MKWKISEILVVSRPSFGRRTTQNRKYIKKELTEENVHDNICFTKEERFL